MQKGIDLITINGRPIDFRVLLIKREKQWIPIGVMGKWAKKNKVVTNYSQGGQAISVKQALDSRKNLKGRAKKIEEVMSRCGKYLAAKHFNYSRMFGLDIAVDKKGEIWILEGNTKPGYKLFRFHQDKQLYTRINHYVKKLRRKR